MGAPSIAEAHELAAGPGRPRGLRCPRCKRPQLVVAADAVRCSACGCEFPIVHGKPALLRPDNELFPLAAYRRAATGTSPRRGGWAKRLIPSPSTNLSGERRMLELVAELERRGGARVLVVGSGDQRALLERRFAAAPRVERVYCDVAPDADVDLLCDAHELPFVDGFFDGIVITGVMECVLSPPAVAAEIHRVLGDGGLVYSEMPFVQQVVTGAYDFTRYTMAGHRRVFRRFEEIASGLRGGPGTVLLWAIERVALSLLAGERAHLAAKALVRSTLFWVKYLDYVVADRPAALDGASGTYFFGRKTAGYELSDRALVESYRGAQQVRPV